MNYCFIAVLPQTMLEDKLRETDWELTQESIDEQVARESYLQWLRDQEKNANKPSSNVCSAYLLFKLSFLHFRSCFYVQIYKTWRIRLCSTIFMYQ